MTPEQINIAIGKVLGKEPWWNYPRHSEIDGRRCRWCGAEATREDYVNYYGSLDAMHEAEKVLRPPVESDWMRWDTYREWLESMMGSEETIHATAAQRAEAFLRTIGKWEEAK